MPLYIVEGATIIADFLRWQHPIVFNCYYAFLYELRMAKYYHDIPGDLIGWITKMTIQD